MHSTLRTYFRSGWAFFIPYLLLYLLYACKQWPATTGDIGAHVGTWIPPLLYLYWLLHGVNFAIALVTLWGWWRTAISPPRPRETIAEKDAQAVLAFRAVAASTHSAPRQAVHLLLPWLLLAAIFTIPGVYLEWPSDPWEHLRRITEWSTLPTVADHSAGYKSFYFFAYSWIGWRSPQYLQLRLNTYYTFVSLLIAWQYYRLALSIGLSKRWAFLAVVANVLTFGNACFSFYRYYAFASTIFAQLGAVALTRIAIEFAQSPRLSSLRCVLLFIRGFPSMTVVQPSLLDHIRSSNIPNFDSWISSGRYTLLRTCVCVLCLISLVAFNHVQGAGISALAVAAIAAWQLTLRRPGALWWLGFGVLAASIATALWWPRRPEIDTVLRPSGWLNAWYGFSLLDWRSPSASRMFQILGGFGLINLVAAIFLMREKHVVGWLTVTPFVALSLPLVGIPFANAIAAEIFVYHRMFFAIPSALALICCCSKTITITSPIKCFSITPILLTIILLAASTLPSQSPYNNRVWNVLSVPPSDLQLESTVRELVANESRSAEFRNKPQISTPLIHFISNVIHPDGQSYVQRSIDVPPTTGFSETIRLVQLSGNRVSATRETMTLDPSAANPSAWLRIESTNLEFVQIRDLPGIATALQTPFGVAMHVFTEGLIEISQTEQYQIEVSIRQCTGPSAISYLAVAWYDAQRNLLPSTSPLPSGAGDPLGWNNGLYSYFGLVGQKTPTKWTTFWKSFGPGQMAAIPPNCKYVRLGAILNDSATSAASIQLTNVRMWRKSILNEMTDGSRTIDVREVILAPSGKDITSPESQAALASRHWRPQQLAADLGAGQQIKNTASNAGGTISLSNPAPFDIYISRAVTQ